MSLLTLEQVLCDTEKLAVRLTEDDNTADDLLSQARCVYKQIDAMKQYSEETMELNELARQRPHSVLVAGIQQESRRLRELQQENRELRAALEDHQNALEVIMSKYRQHVTHLVQVSHLQHLPQMQLDSQYAQLKRQSDKISEMAAVMRMAAQTGEKESLQNIEVITKLATENQGLRDLLNISAKYGSHKPADAPEKTVATDEAALKQLDNEANETQVKVEANMSSESTESSQESVKEVELSPKKPTETTKQTSQSAKEDSFWS